MMRRTTLSLALVVTALLMLTPLAAVVLAQDEGDQAEGERHPVVGAWIGDPTPQDPNDPEELYVFNQDGTLHGFTNFGPSVGTWESTGERSIDLTFALKLEGGAGLAMVRASSEVAEDGQSLSSTYTVEFPAALAGTFPEGELGPATFEAQRINLEPMGEPVAPFEPLPPCGATASPAASPAASPLAAPPDGSPAASPAA
ncbi:hypothetical protein BH24CHL9_BH24CHL9_09730 [soil metagenome]